MTPLTLYVLLAVADHELPSVEFLRQINEDLGGGMSFMPAPRSVYAAIERLTAQKLLSRRLDERGTVLYSLTPHGRRMLVPEHHRLRRVTMLLDKRLDGR